MLRLLFTVAGTSILLFLSAGLLTGGVPELDSFLDSLYDALLALAKFLEQVGGLMQPALDKVFTLSGSVVFVLICIVIAAWFRSKAVWGLGKYSAMFAVRPPDLAASPSAASVVWNGCTGFFVAFLCFLGVILALAAAVFFVFQ